MLETGAYCEAVESIWTQYAGSYPISPLYGWQWLSWRINVETPNNESKVTLYTYQKGFYPAGRQLH